MHLEELLCHFTLSQSGFNFNVALLSTSLKGISAADESTSLQTSCVLVTGFFYTSLHVWLCSAAAVSCSFPGHPFKLRFCSFSGHPFKTWVLRIWKKVKKHIPHLLILVQIKYSKGLLQNQITNSVKFLGVVIVQNTRKRPELPANQGLDFEVVPKLSWFPQARYVTQP